MAWCRGWRGRGGGCSLSCSVGTQGQDEGEGGYVDGWIAMEEEVMMVEWSEWCVE